MRVLEGIVWVLIWSTHWTGWHHTMAFKNDPDHVWCVDCLRRVRR